MNYSQMFIVKKKKHRTTWKDNAVIVSLVNEVSEQH